MVQSIVLLRLSSSIGPFQPLGQPYDMDSGRAFCALSLVSVGSKGYVCVRNVVATLQLPGLRVLV